MMRTVVYDREQIIPRKKHYCLKNQSLNLEKHYSKNDVPDQFSINGILKYERYALIKTYF